jgi:hypothetical protein
MEMARDIGSVLVLVECERPAEEALAPHRRASSDMD